MYKTNLNVKIKQNSNSERLLVIRQCSDVDWADVALCKALRGELFCPRQTVLVRCIDVKLNWIWKLMVNEYKRILQLVKHFSLFMPHLKADCVVTLFYFDCVLQIKYTKTKSVKILTTNTTIAN